MPTAQVHHFQHKQFPVIESIDDLLPFVSDKKEIRCDRQPNGITILCYMFSDSHTFDHPKSIECRGIAFGEDGRVVSRPLHKFFNLGEKEHLRSEVVQHAPITRIMDKLDGSMIATANVHGTLQLRSKKAFSSDVAQHASQFMNEHENWKRFCELLMQHGYTGIMEWMSPEDRIVLKYDKPQLKLLHVRHNITGEYVLLQPQHEVYNWIEDWDIPQVDSVPLDFPQALKSLETARDMEGYVVQFQDGDMVKMKTPWYLRLHHAVTFLRERDIAELALKEELDDVKAALVESGMNIDEVLQIESRVKNRLIDIEDTVQSMYEEGRDWDRKTFALHFKGHPLFGLAMGKYLGKELDLVHFYTKNYLDKEFSLRVISTHLSEDDS